MKPDTTQPREQASEQALMEAACARRYSDGDYKHTSILMRLSTERDAYRAGWKDRAALASPITAPEAPIYLALQRMENPYNEKDHGPGWQVAAHAWDMAIISAMRIAHAPLVPEVAASEQQAGWKRSSAEDLQRDGYEWDREWLESLAAQVNRRGLHVSTSAVEALVCLLVTPAATTASASNTCPACVEDGGACSNPEECGAIMTVFGRATAPSRNAAPLDEDVIWETYGKTHSRTSKNCGHYIMYHRGFQDGAALTQQSAAQAPSLAADDLNGGMHASIFVKVWGDAGGGDAGRIALANYAYDLGKRAAQASHAGADTERVAAYVPGQWFDARTLDEMQAFYLSRLPAIREAAQEHGYAIGLHGSERRDFDLMAMQWRADASPKDTLAHAIAVAACGITREGTYAWESKPSGRFAVSIPICWTDHGNPEFGDKPSLGHIDLSVIDPSWMILFIEKRAEDYARENASSEHDTGATVWHYGGAARDYHNTLVELADDLRAAMSAATEQKEKP